MSRRAPLVFPMRRWPTVLGIVLGVLLMAVGVAVSSYAGSQASIISHSEQGLCGDPVVCAELEAQYRYWSTVSSLAVAGILGGLVMFIWAVIRGIGAAAAAASRPRSPEPICVSCGWPLVWVLPSGQWYCRTCAQYP